MTSLVTFDRNDARNEVPNLARQGYLSVLVESEHAEAPTDRGFWMRAMTVGFSIDADDNPCLLFRTPNTSGDHRFVIRSIPVDRIVMMTKEKMPMNL